MKKLCVYGCGQEAKHKFKNGKWCCNKDHRKCSTISEKRSQGLKKNWRNRSKEEINNFKKKQSEITKQKWKEDNKLGSKEHLEKISKNSKNNWEKNRIKYIQTIRNSWKNNVEQKLKLSERNKKSWESGIFSTDEYRQKLKDGTKKGWDGNEVRRKIISETSKNSWKQPTEKMIKGAKIRDQKVKEYWANPVNREKQRQKQKEIWKDPELRKQAKERSIKNYVNPIYIEKLRKGIQQLPNQKEIFLFKILENLFPNEYEYVGNFKVWINGKNPDFICKSRMKIIEHFGDYWHSEELIGKTKFLHEQDRIKLFRKFNYKTLIVWENELENINLLTIKLKEFHKE